MENQQKAEIVKQLNNRMVDQTLSQSKVATMIGISAATINQMLGGDWKTKDKLISDQMWNKVDAWLANHREWTTVISDPNYKKVYNICLHSQKQSQSRAIIGVPGTGKSNTLREYASKNGNVFYVECAEYWTKKVFLNKLKKAMGLNIEEGSIHEIVESIIEALKRTKMPLIIIDEADKLKDPVLNFFNCFYNETLHRCGFVVAGAPYLEARILKGVRLNKQSYREMYSRLGGEFLQVKPATAASITNICKANGVINDADIERIVARCASGDLRAVKNEVSNYKIRANEN